jgi:hypothetical protein
VADQIVSGDSKEAVAYALLLGIAQKEGKFYTIAGAAVPSADEEWILRTYIKCLNAVSGKGHSGA